MKKQIGKKLTAAVLAATMILTFAGCGAKSEDEEGNSKKETTGEVTPESSAESKEKSSLDGTTISFLTSQSKFREEYRAMAEEVKKDHGITVDFQVVPDNEYYSLVKVKLSTSEVPDVFEYNQPTQNIEIGAQQYCEDLSNEEWVSRLVNPELIKDANDGKIYALPKESSSGFMAIYYNKQVLEDAGITDPQPKTYQEFIDILDKVKATGVIPLYMTNKDTWTTQIYMTSGFPVALNDKAEYTFGKLLKNELTWNDVPEMKEVVNNYKALIDNGYVNEDHLSVGYDTAAEKIGTGKAAMYLITEGFVADVSVKYPDVEMGAFSIPHADVEKLATGAYVQGLFIPSAGKQVEKVKEFLKIWSLPEYQNIFYKTQPGFSAFHDVDGGKVNPGVQNLIDKYVVTGNYTYQLNDQMAICSNIWPDLWSYYVEVISGTKTADEVFKIWQAQYEDFMKQQEQPGF